MEQRPYASAYDEEVVIPQAIEPAEVHKSTGLFSHGLKADDIILIAVILLLLTDEKSDKITVAALVFLFLSGIDLL